MSHPAPSRAPAPAPAAAAEAPSLVARLQASLRAPAVSRGSDGRVSLNPAVAAVAVAAAVAVPAVLALAARAARRSERVEDLLASLERTLAAHALVRTHVGPPRLLASGRYELNVSRSHASGWVLLSTLPGRVRGVARLEAEAVTPPPTKGAGARVGARAGAWAFTALTVEVDKVALDAWREAQRATALARYGADAVARAEPPSPPPPLTVAPGADADAEGQVITLVLA